MGFKTLQACVSALRSEGQLIEIDHPIDPHLQIAEVQRRLFRTGGPAVLFTKPHGSAFPVLVNLYGTQRRVERIFTDSLDRVRRLVELKIDPAEAAEEAMAVLAIAIRCALHAAQTRASGFGAGPRNCPLQFATGDQLA